MSQRTVLIVDDNSNSREVHALLLEHFGYAVLRASDGGEGVRSAREHHPDVILMDVSMPVVDGIEATELLKADIATRDIPVIGISAHGDAATIGRALAVGMDCYLTKPAAPRAVLQTIERCLHGAVQSNPDPAPPAFTLGDQEPSAA